MARALLFADLHARERSLAERLEHGLTLEILRGDRQPGSRLPPVRRLAEHWSTTVPTVQRVLERLGASGLVEARRGSGVRVLDPATLSGLALYPQWLEALAGQPEAAAARLADFLEARRVLLAHVLRSRREALLAALPALLAAAPPPLTPTSAARSAGVAPRAEADLALSAAFVAASGHTALQALMATVEAVVRSAPGVAEALYGEEQAHDLVLAKLAEAVSSEVDPLPVLRDWDAATVDRYRAWLEATCTP